MGLLHASDWTVWTTVPGSSISLVPGSPITEEVYLDIPPPGGVSLCRCLAVQTNATNANRCTCAITFMNELSLIIPLLCPFIATYPPFCTMRCAQQHHPHLVFVPLPCIRCHPCAFALVALPITISLPSTARHRDALPCPAQAPEGQFSADPVINFPPWTR